MNVDYELAQQKRKKMVLNKMIASASKTSDNSTGRFPTLARPAPTLEDLRAGLLGPLGHEDALL
jgi:hypothetical protein